MTLNLKYIVIEVIKNCLIGIVSGCILSFLCYSWLLALLHEDQIRSRQYTSSPTLVEPVDWQSVVDKEAIQRGHELDVMTDQERMRGIVLELEFK